MTLDDLRKTKAGQDPRNAAALNQAPVMNRTYESAALSKVPIITTAKRIRQESKPLLNKLEREWFMVLGVMISAERIKAQAKRYKLGNGIWYKPDFTVSSFQPRQGDPFKETAWEVKGPHAFRGGLENLKVAAAAWPDVRWILVWKENGQWKQQEILP